MDWLSLTLIAVLTLTVYYFFTKKMLNSEVDTDPIFYGAFLQFSNGVICLILALITGYKFALEGESLIAFVIGTACYIIGPALYYTGLKGAELSETQVLNSFGVIWSIVFGTILLHEPFGAGKVIGGLLILVAILVVTYPKMKARLRLGKYELLVLASTVFYALAAVMDNKILQSGNTNTFTYMAWSYIAGGAGMFLVNIKNVRKSGLMLRQKGIISTILVTSIFLVVSYGALFTAYSNGGQVSNMYPIQTLDTITVPLVAIVLLKERDSVPNKVLAALLAFIGVLVIKLVVV